MMLSIALILSFLLGNVVGILISYMRKPKVMGSLLLGEPLDPLGQENYTMLLELEDELSCLEDKDTIALKIVRSRHTPK